MIRRRFHLLVAVLLIGAAATVGAATAAVPRPGPGMMGSYGWGGMMGGAFGGTVQTHVTPAELASVRTRVEKQLSASGYASFTVGEIMAFTNNDYVLVKDASGTPAFELIADPSGSWLMPEPQSMMWNTRYGMLHSLGSGAPVTTATAAKARADAWLARNRPGEKTADATALPGYFTIDVVAGGPKVGMLSVNATTGAVWFHTWHGKFLADHDF